MKNKVTQEQLQSAVDKCLSMAQVCRELEMNVNGGNYSTIKNKIKLFNINVDHFTGAGWNVGDRYKPINKVYTNEEVFKEDSLLFKPHNVKQRLFKERV